MRRLIVLFSAVMALVATFVAPVGARPPASGPGSTNEKVTICHATRSLTNPYVVITIDVAAWQPDGSDDVRAHGPNHDREKNEIVWTDVFLADGPGDRYTSEDCPPVPPSPPPPTQPPPSAAACDKTGDDVYIVTFGGKNLLSHRYETPRLRIGSVGTFDIPSGEYLVTLGSQDLGHPQAKEDQLNEQWRVDFGAGVYSAYSADLPDSDTYGETFVGGVTLDATSTTSIVAEHWDANNANHSESADSIVPYCAALVRDGDVTNGG